MNYIENKFDGIDFAVRYARKALKNKDTIRLRLAVNVIKNVCEQILEKINQNADLDKRLHL